MPYEVVPLGIDFFKMSAVAMETTKMLQHHNLLGNQISSKSKDLCILAAILYSKWPP
jgi:hypothetical protein